MASLNQNYLIFSVPRPISVPRDSTEMWCGPGIMLEVGILVSVFKSSTNLATLAL